MRALSGFFLGLLILVLAFPASASEEPPHFLIGDVHVWCLRDTGGEMDVASIFPGDPGIIKRFVPTGKTESNINAFLYKIGDRYILADTGLGSASGPRASLLPSALNKLRVAPEHIDTVIVTHMHGDHIGGLLKNGEPFFPNAQVLIGRTEHGFWLNPESREKFPANRANFDMARAVVEAYGDRVDLFDFGTELAPGLTALEAIGHTPGHAVLLLESGGESLLCIADLIHAAVLQFPRPDMCPRYDMDPETAAATRLRYLQKVAKENIPIAGMHLPAPGVGRVAESGDNAFEFTPGL